MTNYTTKHNDEFNSTEIYFESKPTEAEREALKKNRFRWHSVKKCWYGRKTAEEVAQILGESESTKTAEEKPLTLEDLPEAITIDDGGLYDGWEGALMIERKFEQEAKQFCEAIKVIAEKPENLDNLECYLSRHFPAWIEKYANTPETITEELKAFAEMII